jgi:FMN reductase
VALIVTLSGSPSASSRTFLLAQHISERLAADGFEVDLVDVRKLPAEDLLAGRAEAPLIREAAALVQRAQGVVVATPVYKAAYSGVLKTFLDLLPQFALQGKSVLPVATGGSMAHVLSIDYALRPVLASMGAGHVTNGYFFLDKQLERHPGDRDGELHIEAAALERFAPVYRDFITSVRLYDRARRDQIASAGLGDLGSG